ncbi:hypothetical protein ILUMI_09389 [Ignelater luminosus]|uniref:BED-type domain-containing protein n=1 Tax=Ignelater luminosus TaxID=2038154 RepID=A0A8K0D3Y7_IGNLU|nr:hypothetical protein ILUMI_09389 [Ignelater luminosus]
MASRKRSEVGSFFEQMPDNKAKCNFCSQILSFKGGSTYNLTRHLKNKHPHSVGVESDTKENELILRMQKKQQALLQDLTASKRRIHLQKKIFQFQDDINFQLMQTIVKNYLPFQIVESDYFKKFVNELNPGYQLPSRKTVSKVLLPQYYNMTKERVFNKLKTAEAICLTTDGWTSVANESYLAVTAHFLNKANDLQSVLLECYKYTDSHTAVNLSEELQRIVENWQIKERIVAVVSDNAANIVAAIKRTEWKHIPCFAHTVNLIIRSSLDTIRPIRQKVKNLVEFFKRSPQASEKLHQMQKQLGKPELRVKQDVVTRWNSTYDTFKRIIEIKEALMSKCVAIFKDVTEEISAEKEVTISKVIIFSAALVKYCNKFSKDNQILPDIIKKLIESLQASSHKRFHNIEYNKTFAEATLIDPRFKKYGFSDNRAFETVKQNLVNYVTNLNTLSMPSSTSENETRVKNSLVPHSTLWEAFDETVSNVVSNSNPTASGIIEIEKFLEEPLLPRTSNPFLWWEERKMVYPRLYTLMQKRLCIIATSVPSERIFSKAGQTIVEKRSKLSGNKVSMLLFLNVNL